MIRVREIRNRRAIYAVFGISLFSFGSGANAAVDDSVSAPVVSPVRSNFQSRVALPDPKSLAASRRQVDEAYGERLRSSNSAIVKTTIDELLSEGGRTDANAPADRYALLDAARVSAIRLADLSTVLNAIDELNAQFIFDATSLKFESAEALANGSMDPTRLALFYLYLAHLAGAHAPNTMSKSIAAAESISARVADARVKTALRVRCLAARASIDDTTHFESMRAKLAVNRNDSRASEVVGWHQGVHLKDWPTALPLLASAADVGIKGLAAAELKKPVTLKERMELGDGWWDVSNRKDVRLDEAEALRRHAGEWYALARAGAKGLDAALIAKRLDQINGWDAVNALLAAADVDREIPAANGAVIDLLRLVDLNKDIVNGAWAWDQGSLVCEAGTIARLRLPYSPPAEYDFLIEYTVSEGNEAIVQAFATGDRDCAWVVSALGNTTHGFEIINGEWLADSALAVHGKYPRTNGRACRSEVRLRRDRVEGLVDGHRLVDLHTDPKGLTIPGFYAVGCESLGIASFQNHAEFHAIRVREVGQKGEITKRFDPKRQAADLIASKKFEEDHVVSLGELKPRAAQVGYKEFTVSADPIDADMKLTVGGKPCNDYLFAHAPSSLVFDIPAGAMLFRATGAGPPGLQHDDCDSWRYMIYVDGNEVLVSAPLSESPEPHFEIPLPPDARSIELRIDSRSNDRWDHSMWANPQFVFPKASKKIPQIRE